MINLNSLASKVVRLEGKKINLSIAQVKEVLKIVLDDLAMVKPSEVLRLLERRPR